jgi:hypothetical protein
MTMDGACWRDVLRAHLVSSLASQVREETGEVVSLRGVLGKPLVVG